MNCSYSITQSHDIPEIDKSAVVDFKILAEVPESFSKGVADCDAGRVVDMETVIGGQPPPKRE
jgi:hypothetical protein